MFSSCSRHIRFIKWVIVDLSERVDCKWDCFSFSKQNLSNIWLIGRFFFHHHNKWGTSWKRKLIKLNKIAAIYSFLNSVMILNVFHMIVLYILLVTKFISMNFISRSMKSRNDLFYFASVLNDDNEATGY
jgi:hypothetical protein